MLDTIILGTVTKSRNTTSVLVLLAIQITALFIVSVLLIGLSQYLYAQTGNTSSTSTIFHTINGGPPKSAGLFSSDSKPYNLTFGEWTARWWQWGYSIPKNINPAYDDNGRFCVQKQSGPVWFLAGTYGHRVVRLCDIPSGKAILLPILNSECSFAEFPKLKKLSELRTCAKTIQDQVIKVNASVDGVPLSHLEKYRVESPPFNFTLPQGNILGLSANTSTQAIADGNWVFLKPLSTGIHKIMFKGKVQPKTDGNTGNSIDSFAFPSGWDFETIYNLTVKNATNIYHFPNQSSIIERQNTIVRAAQTNIAKLLADMVGNALHHAVSLLETTNKEPAVQNVSFANFITKKYMGIPASMDLAKRNVAQDILARDKDFGSIYFLTPDANVYMGEPFPDQKQLPKLNYADRDWYKGVKATNNTYISAVFMSASIHSPATAIAVPVYSVQKTDAYSYDNGNKTNKVISGYWVGILDLRSILQSIRNLNLTNDERVIVVDHNGSAIVDFSPSSATNDNASSSSSKLKDFSYLKSTKALIQGNAGSLIETLNGTKKLMVYQPIQIGNRFWGVILIDPVSKSSSFVDIRNRVT
ncbi:MAG: cache domain-containing protein [Nitrososphaeraceae archaeon]